MMKRHVLLVLCAAALSAPAQAQDRTIPMDNPYDDVTLDRPALENPYDSVASIQQRRSGLQTETQMQIRELYMQSATRADDADQVIRDRLASIRSEEISDRDRAELLNLGTPGLVTERIEADAAERDLSVPSLSQLGNGDADPGKPQNLFLESWELLRGPDGTPVVGRVGDPMSRIEIRTGMILGEFGRVMAVRDTEDAYFIVLESGDRIQGAPRRMDG